MRIGSSLNPRRRRTRCATWTPLLSSRPALQPHLHVKRSSTMPTKFRVATSLAIVGLAAPALAHHSHASYDISKWIALEGTVKRVVLIAPHSIVYLDVKGDNGETVTWALEATAPA